MRGYVIFLAMYRGIGVGFQFLRAVSAHPFYVCVSGGLVCPTGQHGVYLYQWLASVYASPKTKATIPPVIAQYAPGSTGRSKISLIKIKIKFATTIRNLRDFNRIQRSLCILSPPQFFSHPDKYGGHIFAWYCFAGHSVTLVIFSR